MGSSAASPNHPNPWPHDRDHTFVVLAAEFLRDAVIDLKRVWEARGRVSRAVCEVVDDGGPKIAFR
ncbi:hypothetical protein [Frankia sp. R82]|uniref:hypothetical protein n=1 Tax=Frankia sp. R82 TaxID=2950553 RepID=UPI0020433A34|nr:hypothetical protein [Frankia sp. R82]MCM3886586.1 hypothetical protein [Frankia sp. R82]